MARVLGAREVVIHLHGDSVEPAPRPSAEPCASAAPRPMTRRGGCRTVRAATCRARPVPWRASCTRALRCHCSPPHHSPGEVRRAIRPSCRTPRPRRTWRRSSVPVPSGGAPPGRRRVRDRSSSRSPVPSLPRDPSYELTGSATIGAILRESGLEAPPHAVLTGGYAGAWIHGQLAWETPMEPASLSALGATRGCGLIGVLPHGACGIAETARIVDYLAAESAGQCGPCVHGLPVLAPPASAPLARGRGGRSALRHIHRAAAALPGSGACSHPDGVVRLVVSALEVFQADVSRHRKGTPCRMAHHRPLFPLVASGDHP